MPDMLLSVYYERTLSHAIAAGEAESSVYVEADGSDGDEARLGDFDTWSYGVWSFCLDLHSNHQGSFSS